MQPKLKHVGVATCLALASGAALFILVPKSSNVEEDLCGREAMKVEYLERAMTAYYAHFKAVPSLSEDWERVMSEKLDRDVVTLRPFNSIDAWGYEYVSIELGDGVFAVSSRGIEVNCVESLVQIERSH